MCRDVFHCLPSELDREDWDRIETHLVCMNVEAKVRKKKEPATPAPRGSKK